MDLIDIDAALFHCLEQDARRMFEPQWADDRACQDSPQLRYGLVRKRDNQTGLLAIGTQQRTDQPFTRQFIRN